MNPSIRMRLARVEKIIADRQDEEHRAWLEGVKVRVASLNEDRRERLAVILEAIAKLTPEQRRKIFGKD